MLTGNLHWLRYRVRRLLNDGTAMEPVYQGLVGRELARLGIADDFHPVGHAGNYSLLYVLLRVSAEVRPRSVLELGCGQSTQLLAQLVRRSDAQLVSLEEDAGWSKRVAAVTGTAVLHAPLQPLLVAGRRCRFYPLELLPAGRCFDLVLVDGPVGTPRWSRYGAVALVPLLNREAFTVVFDDAERPGEQDSIGAFRRELHRAGLEFGEVLVRARNWQQVFYSRSRPQLMALGDAVG